MKNIRSILLLSILAFGILSCEETPEDIQSTLFGEEGLNGDVNEFGFYDPEFNIEITYDDNGNGDINYGEFIGFDFYIENPNTSSFTNLSVQITSISPSTYISNFDNEPAELNILLPGAVRKPNSYAWCWQTSLGEFVNCFQNSYDLYLGTFVFSTIQSSTSISNNVTINFFIEYMYDGNTYYANHTEVITIEP